MIHAQIVSSDLLRPAPAQGGKSGGRAPCGCGSCERCQNSLQRSAFAGGPSAVPDSVHGTLQRAGRPLDTGLRSQFESRLGGDFSGVRIHDDAAAAASARDVSARAYTVGRDIVFGAGHFRPQAPDGQRLLAHELTHVNQQRAQTPRDSDLRIGAPNDALEAAADRSADRYMRGTAAADRSSAVGAVLQRDPLPGVPAALPVAENAEIGASDAISREHPALLRIAAAARTNPSARVSLSADLTSGSKNSGEQQKRERGQLSQRMYAIKAVLVALGVAEDRIDISPATSFSTAAQGQVKLRSGSALGSLPLMPGSLGGPLVPLAPQQPAAPTPQGPVPAAALPSLDLEVKFGPVTISLPKEVRVKLPIALTRAKSLVIDLSYEVPAKFSFKLTLDGTPHVRVSLKAGAEVDAKKGAVTGSAGLVIDTVATTCHAPSANELRDKIKSAGDKLNKAAGEFAAAATFEDKMSKGIDIAGAIGEMYDAVEKAKAGCKSTPRASFELGYKRLLSPGSETDPSKQPPLDTIGVTGTWRF